MRDRVEGRRRLRARRERTFQIVTQRCRGDAVEGADGVRPRGGVGRIHFDQKVRRISAHDIAREVLRYLHREQYLAFLQQAARFLRRMGLLHDVEVAGILQRHGDRAREHAWIVHGYHGRQRLRIVIDREAEQEKLHQRHAHDHRQRDTIAPHLQKFFQQDGVGTREGERVAHFASSCRWMNTSSRLGLVSLRVTPVSFLYGATVFSSAARSRPDTRSAAPKKPA